MKIKHRVKQFMIPLLVALTIFTGLLGTNSINSDKYYQEHGVAVTSLTLPKSTVDAGASSFTDALGKSVVGEVMQTIDNITDKVISTVAPNNADFPAGSYGMRDAWRRVYTKDETAQANWVAEYIYSLRSSNAIHSYTNGDQLSQIVAGVGKLFSGVGGLIIMLLLAGATFVQMIGGAITSLVGALNIFQYLYDALNNTTSSGTSKAIRDGLQPLIDMWVQFKPIIMLIATLMFMFVIVRVVMGHSSNRGKIFGTGAMKYLSVFFAWGVLPMILGGIISYTTAMTATLGITDSVEKQIQTTYYNAKAPFASAFYALDTNGAANVTTENKGGIEATDVYASWANNADLNLKGGTWSIITQWMSGSSFDADDVNAMLGWNGDASDANGNKGYFSHNAKADGDSVKGTDDNGASWAASHVFLNQKLGTTSASKDSAGTGGSNAVKKGQQIPVVADDSLSAAGWTDDLFAQTASGSTKTVKGASNRLRKLAMTHVIAVWGIDSNGRMSVSRQTGMNTSPKVSWNSVTLVGDTPVAKFANWSELVAQMFFTVMYAIVAYAGIITILARTIGTALMDQLRASTGSIGAIARAILGVLLSAMIMWYIAISVSMVGPMIGAVNQFIKGFINLAGNNGVSNLAGQVVSLVTLWFGGALVVRMFMSIRGALMDGATSMVNQIAEAIDRAMGIQPGADSSASAGMKMGANDSRRNMVAGFSAMDKTKKTLQSSQHLATNGLKKVSDMGANALDAAAPAAELAATAYAGPAAGKAAGVATKVGSKTLKAVSKTTKAADDAISADETMDDAGAKGTVDAMKNNTLDGYHNARNAGESTGKALTSAAKRGLDTAAGNQEDVGDPNQGDERKQNDFNKVVNGRKALQESADAKGNERKGRQLQRQLADKTALLTNQSEEFTEALQQHGAAQFADKADGKVTNGSGLAAASKQLQSAKHSQVEAGTERAEQETTVNKAREDVNKATEQLRSTKAAVRQQVGSGQMSREDGKAVLASARNDLSQKQEVLNSEKSKMDTLVKTQRTAEQSIQKAQGAVNMMQEAVSTEGKDATFTKPSGLATVQQSAQQVRDTHKSMVKTQRNVDTLVQAADSRMNGSTTTSQTGRLNASRSGAIPTASGSSTTGSATQTVNDKQSTNVGVQHNVSEGVTQSHSIAGTSTSGLQSGQHTSPVKSTPGLASGTSTAQNTTQAVNDRQTTNVNTQHHVNNVENHTGGQTVTSTSRGTSGNVSSNTSTPSTPTGTSRSRNVQQHVTDRNTTNVDVTRESVNDTVSHAKDVVTNLEKHVQDNRTKSVDSSQAAKRINKNLQQSAQRRRYSTKLKDLTNDTN